VGTVPPTVQAIWDEAPVQRTAAEWALQWVWNQPEVSVVLSGMSTMEQVVENVESAGRSGVGLLNEEELAIVDRVREQYRELSPIPCTKCEYCLPCPNGVKIPTAFEIYNELMMYGDEGGARWFYSTLDEAERANNCIQCEECLDKCPQSIEIPDWLAKVHAALCREEAGWNIPSQHLENRCLACGKGWILLIRTSKRHVGRCGVAFLGRTFDGRRCD
jgi:predicted aldo/keto reductase-like oxidoreductase